MDINYVEMIGYLASFFVLMSFTMKDTTKLRIINIIGCLFFVYYGFLLKISLPIIITNSAIIIVNSYHLIKSSKN